MDRLVKRLETENLRITTARKTIFDILQGSDRALSAQEVCVEIHNSTNLKADQASVYRNLSLFNSMGLAHRLQSGKYAICQQEEDHQHHHLHIVANCSMCGKTYEAEQHPNNLCQLAEGFAKHIKGFKSFRGITLEGVCEKCN